MPFTAGERGTKFPIKAREEIPPKYRTLFERTLYPVVENLFPSWVDEKGLLFQDHWNFIARVAWLYYNSTVFLKHLNQEAVGNYTSSQLNLLVSLVSLLKTLENNPYSSSSEMEKLRNAICQSGLNLGEPGGDFVPQEFSHIRDIVAQMEMKYVSNGQGGTQSKTVAKDQASSTLSGASGEAVEDRGGGFPNPDKKQSIEQSQPTLVSIANTETWLAPFKNIVSGEEIMWLTTHPVSVIIAYFYDIATNYATLHLLLKKTEFTPALMIPSTIVAVAEQLKILLETISFQYEENAAKYQAAGMSTEARNCQTIAKRFKFWSRVCVGLHWADAAGSIVWPLFFTQDPLEGVVYAGVATAITAFVEAIENVGTMVLFSKFREALKGRRSRS